MWIIDRWFFVKSVWEAFYFFSTSTYLNIHLYLVHENLQSHDQIIMQFEWTDWFVSLQLFLLKIVPRFVVPLHREGKVSRTGSAGTGPEVTQQ